MEIGCIYKKKIGVYVIVVVRYINGKKRSCNDLIKLLIYCNLKDNEVV